MRVLFVYTNINTWGLGAKCYHFGLGTMSAVLKGAGHETALCYLHQRFDSRILLDRIASFQPDILAFTSDSTQFVYVKQLIRAAKGRAKFAVLGGTHASLCPQCLETAEGLDAVCVGEGEGVLLDLVGRLERGEDPAGIPGLNVKQEGGIVKTPARSLVADLDILPFGDRDLFRFQEIIDSDFGRAPFLLSRSCPYQCTYCASPALAGLQAGTAFRVMSVERAIRQLETIRDRFRVKSFFLVDDTFTVKRQYVMDFCAAYRERVGVPFEINARPETASLEMFRALKAAGCFQVHMGIESGNEDFRRRVLNRNLSNEQIVKAFALAREAGLKTRSFNIVGFPGETRELHRETIELNRKIRPDGLFCYVYQPFPGTRLHDVCVERGLLPSDVFEQEYSSRRESLLNMEQFPAREIARCHRRFAFEVFRTYSWRKAVFNRVYYSRFGGLLVRLLGPFRGLAKRLAPQ